MKGGGTMASRAMRALLMAVCAMAFVCLLLSGAPRLVASDAEAVSVSEIGVRAALTAPARQDEPDTAASAQTPVRRGERAVQTVSLCASAAPALRCDANGNVLTRESYLRAVYRAFSLGDGFV